MGTAGNSDEVRQMATAMVALDHSGWQQRWSASNGNVEWQRQWSASSGNRWAGSGDEVRRVTAMECAKWQWLATAMQCVEW
jgi:hypothetical protein